MYAVVGALFSNKEWDWGYSMLPHDSYAPFGLRGPFFNVKDEGQLFESRIFDEGADGVMPGFG